MDKFLHLKINKNANNSTNCVTRTLMFHMTYNYYLKANCVRQMLDFYSERINPINFFVGTHHFHQLSSPVVISVAPVCLLINTAL